MKPPAFWKNPSSFAGRVLAPLGLLYAFFARASYRLGARKAYRSSVRVVCVGNVSLGGTGKTPAALALANLFRSRGKTPVFLTRGYGGSLAGVVVSSGHSASHVGDESLLLAESSLTVVDADRARGAKIAEKLGADVIIMDDGFQNPKLVKDFSLLVFDGEAGLGNGRVFPAGPLREPLSEGLKRADAALVVGRDAAGLSSVLSSLPFFSGKIVPDPDALSALKGKKFLAFAGIGRPEKFFRFLEEHGLDVTETVSFVDHYPYSEADAEALSRRAESLGAELLTTEKDARRFPVPPSRKLYTLPIKFVFEDGGASIFQRIFPDENI